MSMASLTVAKKIITRFITRLFIITLSVFVPAIAMSAFPAQAALSQIGPIDPNNGFPLWYEDSQKTRISLCIAGANGFADPNCILPGIDEGFDASLPVSFPENFPVESFWWIADSDVVPAGVAGSGRVHLRYALESAFASDTPETNQQIAFLRVNLGPISGLVPGAIYTVTHPFGSFTVTADALGVAPRHRDEDGAFVPPLTQVSAGSFLGAPETQISTFLKMANPTPPAGYLGDGITLGTITSGPNGNFVRVTGPNIDTTDYDGDGNANQLTIIHWTVAGKLFVETAPAPDPTPTPEPAPTPEPTPTSAPDITPPTSPVLQAIAENNIINGTEKSAIVVVGTTEPQAAVSITTNDGSNSTTAQGTADNTGSFSVTVNGTLSAPTALIDGAITVSVIATDTAGNISVTATKTALLDTVAPIVSGVSNNNVYNTNRTPVFSEGTATLNDALFTSGTTISADGNYALIATDTAGNSISVLFQIDKTGPSISGVIGNGIYSKSVRISFSDGAATLNGASFVSGSIVSAPGNYTLVVTDSARNSTTVNFTISKDVNLNGVAVVNITRNSATITWATPAPSTGTIFFGTKKKIKKMKASVTDSAEGTSHTVTLGGLKKKKTYYFRISTATSDSTNMASSGVMRFKTAKR